MPPSPVQLARDEPMARELFPLGNDDRKSQFASDSCWREMDSNLQYAGTVHPVRRTGGGSGSLRRTRCRLGGSASF
jgi:hypothetical protein